MLLSKIKNKSLELFRYREMFVGLVSREVRARYKGSALGFLWSLINPLMMMGIYSLVFSVYLRVDVTNYALFLFCGLLPWTWFSTSINNTAGAIATNSNLIKKVYFPLEILPTLGVTTNLINFILSLPVLFGFMLFYQVPFTPYLLLLPVLIAIQFLITLGLALLLSTLNAFFRDVEQLLGPLVLVWFYATPIIYPASMMPEKFKFLFYLNPMAPLMVSYQSIFYAGTPPSWLHLAYCLLIGVVLFLLGYAVFYRNKFEFAEVV